MCDNNAGSCNGTPAIGLQQNNNGSCTGIMYWDKDNFEARLVGGTDFALVTSNGDSCGNGKSEVIYKLPCDESKTQAVVQSIVVSGCFYTVTVATSATCVSAPVDEKAPKSGFVNCYESGASQSDGRPLTHVTSVTSVDQCQTACQTYTYMGFKCPQTTGFECWCGNSLSGASSKLHYSECYGTHTTVSYPNDDTNCLGYPSNGVYSSYEDETNYGLGGNRRENIFSVVAGFVGCHNTDYYSVGAIQIKSKSNVGDCVTECKNYAFVGLNVLKQIVLNVGARTLCLLQLRIPDLNYPRMSAEVLPQRL
eukprot:UN25573